MFGGCLVGVWRVHSGCLAGATPHIYGVDNVLSTLIEEFLIVEV